MREEQPCPCSRPCSASPESSSGFWRAPVQHPSSGAASAVAVAQAQPDTDPGCSLSRSNGSPGSCAGSSGVGQQPQLSPAQTWGLQLQGQEGSRKRGREMCAVIAEPLPAPCAAPAALKHLLGAVTSVKTHPELFLLPWMCWRLCWSVWGPVCGSAPFPGLFPRELLLPAPALHPGVVLSIFPLPFPVEVLSQLLWAGARVMSIRSTREEPQAHRTDNFVLTGSWEEYFSPGSSVLHSLS